jgi:hypothetical protein
MRPSHQTKLISQSRTSAVRLQRRVRVAVARLTRRLLRYLRGYFRLLVRIVRDIGDVVRGRL